MISFSAISTTAILMRNMKSNVEEDHGMVEGQVDNANDRESAVRVP